MFRNLNLPSGITHLGIFGQPYHGLAKQGGSGNATLVLPNATTKDLGRRFTNGNTYLSARPGWSAVERDGADAARDAANGWTWPPYWLFGGFFALPSQAWVFFDGDGSAWQVYITTAPLTLHYRRFGLFSAGEPPEWANLSPSAPPSSIYALTLESHTTDGAKACFRDVNAGKLFEVTITGSGVGNGPDEVAVTEVDLVLENTYSISKTDGVAEVCFVEGNEQPYLEAASESLILEYIAKSAYIGDDLSHDIIRLSASMSLTGTFVCSKACPDQMDRTLSIVWVYDVTCRKDAGDAVSLLSATVTRSGSSLQQFMTYTDCPPPMPSPTPPGETTISMSDSVTVNGSSWGGAFSRHDTWVSHPRSDLCHLGTPPTLAAKVGVGDYDMDFLWDLPPVDYGEGMILSLTTTPPDFCQIYVAFSSEIKILSGRPDRLTPLVSDTGHTGNTTPEYYCGFNAFGSSGVGFLAHWGGYSLDITNTTNNIITIKKTLQDYGDANATVSWGPCIATEAADAAVLLGTNHWASYQPASKTLARSTTEQLCWI